MTRAGICGELVGIRSVCMQLADQLQQAQASAPDQVVEAATAAEESAVSFQSELPQPLQQAMVAFIERCPNFSMVEKVGFKHGFVVEPRRNHEF